MNLFRIFQIWKKWDKSFFDVPVCEQISYLNSLSQPKSEIDRSYKQYLCQNFFVPCWKILVENLASLCLFPIVILCLWMNRFWIKKAHHIPAIGDLKGFEEVIPEELRAQYTIDNNAWINSFSLSFKDILFIIPIFIKYIMHPFFSFKCMIKISMYSSMIKRHQPIAFIVHDECSFTSSVLTVYCHNRDVKHINVMHGEKLFYIRDSFFNFDEFYVWDKYYIELFQKLRANTRQFIIAVPQSLKFDVPSNYSKKYYADYKYYLARINREDMESIVNSMRFVKAEGKIVKYRPHPRYTNMNILESIVDREQIEYPNEISIASSIVNMQVAVGSYTTVLNQAIHNNKKILLDDVTYKKQYDKLSELMYIFANRDYPLLSEKQQ